MRMPEGSDREKYEKYRAAAVLALLLHCGLRRWGLLNLETRDIDKSVEPGEPWVIKLRVTKGGESGTVKANEVVQFWLDKWEPIRTEWAARYQNHSGALFPIDRKRRLAVNGYTGIWRRLKAEAGITRRLTPHACRHWATSQVCALEGLVAAQEFARHSSPTTTARFYLHGSEEEQIRATCKLAKRFSELVGETVPAAAPLRPVAIAPVDAATAEKRRFTRRQRPGSPRRGD
jgi:integrase